MLRIHVQLILPRIPKIEAHSDSPVVQNLGRRIKGGEQSWPDEPETIRWRAVTCYIVVGAVEDEAVLLIGRQTRRERFDGKVVVCEIRRQGLRFQVE